jgi:hypothetical protein
VAVWVAVFASVYFGLADDALARFEGKAEVGVLDGTPTFFHDYP